jgi:tetratricopeptide (TPR) repeat protein
MKFEKELESQKMISHTLATIGGKGKTMKLEQKTLRVSFFIATLLTLILSPSLGLCAEVSPEKALQHKGIADSYLRQGKTALAITEYKKALEIDPSSTATYFNLAIAHNTDKNFKETASALEKLVSIDFKDVEAQYNLACLRLSEGNLEKALFHLEQAKTCCASTSEFAPLILNAFEFVDKVKTMDGHVQQALFLLLQQQGLPLLSQN